MIIRDAEQKDHRELCELILYAIEDLAQLYTAAEDDGEARGTMEEFIRMETSRFSYRNCIAAEEDGQILGAVLCFGADRMVELDRPMLELVREKGRQVQSYPKECTGKRFYIDSVGVYGSSRGKGVGTALIHAAEERGHRLGYDTISLIVDEKKEKTKKLYERLGFCETGTVTLMGHKYYAMDQKKGEKGQKKSR